MLFPAPTARKSRSFAARATRSIVDIMCKPPTNHGKETPLSSNLDPPGSSSPLSAALHAMMPSSAFLANPIATLKWLKPPYTARRILLLLFLASFLSLASLYAFHRGFRRTVQFWRGMAPLVLRYKYVRLKAERIDRCDSEELERRLDVYREESAPRLVDLILSMGGIYVKIGQGMR